MQSNAALEYDYSIAKLFTYTTILFGFLGMLVGTIIAAQMAFPELNYLLGEYGTFSRLRPLHTNTVVFGFTVSGIFATWFYIGQRVLKVSMAESSSRVANACVPSSTLENTSLHVSVSLQRDTDIYDRIFE